MKTNKLLFLCLFCLIGFMQGAIAQIAKQTITVVDPNKPNPQPAISGQGGKGGVVQSGATQIDVTYYYRLTNNFLGTGRSLDTYAGTKNEPFMGKTGNYSGQYWKLTDLGNGYYRLTNSFLGENRSLDTYSGDNNDLFMGNTGNYSGQYWKLTDLGNGKYRLTNSFLKEERALDTYSNEENKPFMGKTGNFLGQYWTLTKIVPISSVH